MSGFNPIKEFVEDSITLTVPDRDNQPHTYRITEVDAETGLFVQTLMGLAAAAEARQKKGAELTAVEKERLTLDDDEERDMMARLLGPVLDEMLADKIPWSLIQLVNQTVVVWIMSGKDQAADFWNAGGQAPKGKKPQDHKVGAKSARQGSTGTSSRKPVKA